MKKLWSAITIILALIPITLFGLLLSQMRPRAQTYGDQNAPPPMKFFDTGIQANGGPINTQDATHGFQIQGATILNSSGYVSPSSTTGAATQTFTNSPCTGNTTAQWLPVQITGQTGTWFVAACQ